MLSPFIHTRACVACQQPMQEGAVSRSHLVAVLHLLHISDEPLDHDRALPRLNRRGSRCWYVGLVCRPGMSARFVVFGERFDRLSYPTDDAARGPVVAVTCGRVEDGEVGG